MARLARDEAQPGPEPGRRPVSVAAGLRSRWALVAMATTLYWFAAQSLRPLVPLRLAEFGASEPYIGVVVATYAISGLVLAVPGGRLIDRLSVVRVLWISLAVMAVVGVGYALATSPGQILVVVVVNGLAELGAWLALQALITHAGSGEFRSRQLWLFSMGWGIGSAAGPVVGGLLLEHAGFPALGWMFTGLALAATSVVFVPYRPGGHAASDPRGGSAAGKSALLTIAARPVVKGVLLSSYVALFVNAIRMSFYPLYLQQQGLAASRIGLLLSVFGIGSLLIRFPLHWLVQRCGAGRVLVWSMWLCVLPMSATPWLAGSYGLLLAAAALTGAASGINPPVTVELMARHTQPTERGVAMGMRIASNRLAQVTQPLLFGGLASSAGVMAAFPIAGVLLAALTLWTWRESERISAPSHLRG